MWKVVGLLAVVGVALWHADARNTIHGEAGRIIDGDTLDVAGQRVRLWGIDAPERGTATWRASRDHLADLVRGAELVCHVKDRNPPTPRYRGRAVALCEIDGQDIALALIAAGHVEVDRRFAGDHYGAAN